MILTRQDAIQKLIVMYFEIFIKGNYTKNSKKIIFNVPKNMINLNFKNSEYSATS